MRHPFENRRKFARGAGSIGLLLRKKWVFYAFAVSPCGLFVTSIYNFVITDGADIIGQTVVIFTVVIWIVALFLLWHSWTQENKGVLT